MNATAQFFKLGSGVIKLELDFDWSAPRERRRFLSMQEQMLKQGFTVSLFPKRRRKK